MVDARTCACWPRHCELVLLRIRSIGETDLVRRDGKWYLYATVEAPAAALTDPMNGFVGVDMGIVNIATSSDGDMAAGAQLNRYRKRQLNLRKRLQAKKTSSARRLLKKRRRKEARFAATDLLRDLPGQAPRIKRLGRIGPETNRCCRHFPALLGGRAGRSCRIQCWRAASCKRRQPC